MSFENYYIMNNIRDVPLVKKKKKRGEKISMSFHRKLPCNNLYAFNKGVSLKRKGNLSGNQHIRFRFSPTMMFI